MGDFKALDTRYAGHKFRSRLEAKWAVYFDALGARWEYEKQGFDLGNGQCYLPDFWMPDLECWLEVKPEEPTPNEEAKCELLGNGTGWAVVIVWGMPEKVNLAVYCGSRFGKTSSVRWWHSAWDELNWGLIQGRLCILLGDTRTDRVFLGPTCEHSFQGMKHAHECDANTGLLRVAATRAQDARFEHGAKP